MYIIICLKDVLYKCVRNIIGTKTEAGATLPIRGKPMTIGITYIAIYLKMWITTSNTIMYFFFF